MEHAYEKTMSIDSFIAQYATKSFKFNHDLPVNADAAVMDALSQDDRKTVDDARHYFHGKEFRIRIEAYAPDASQIYTQDSAAGYVTTMERYLGEIEQAKRKVIALMEYYKQAASLFASTVKVPAFVLSRNKRDNSAPVTYMIGRGYYDRTIDRLVIQSWKEGDYTGKQHREAHAKFEQLVKGEKGCLGFEISNQYTSHVKQGDHTIAS